MATLLYDYDADSLTAGVGSTVPTWTDSVASRALTQTTAGLQPTLVAGPNSHKALQFNGDVLASTATATAQSAVTISMVMRVDAAATVARAGVLAASTAAATNDYDANVGAWNLTTPFSTSETAFESMLVGGAPTGTDSRIKTSSHPFGQFVIVLVTLGTDGVPMKLYSNGTVDTVSTGGADVADMTLARLNLGSRYYGSAADYGRFTISKLRIHAGRMTTAERANENSLLSDRYGISVSDYVAPSDVAAPSVPTGLTATASGSASISVSWATSTDNVGVASYRVLRDGVSVATAVTAPPFVDNVSLKPATTYQYTVSAVDAAGNRSAESAAVSATTPAVAGAAGRLSFRWTGTALVQQRLDRWSGSSLFSRVFDRYDGTTTPAPPAVGYPGSLGTLSARPTWTNSAVAASPIDQPAVSTRTRVLQLPNLPTAGNDLTAAWTAYFGNQTGTRGTWQSGDQVRIPDGEWFKAANVDVPPQVSDVEIVLGSATGSFILTSTSAVSGNNTPPQIGLRVLSANNITIRAASSAYPAILRSRGIAGRGDKNQQGHALLEVEYCSGFRAQDLILRDSKAAGVFMYRATNYWFNRCRVERSKADAWHAANGCSYGTYSDCSSDGAGDDMMAFVHYDRTDSPESVSHHMEVYRYTGKRNGHGRGFAVICCHDIYADQIILEGTAAASVIIDREARSGGSFAEQGIYNVLLQRFLISGGNWSEQDHGSVFIGNGNTGNTVNTVRLESFQIVDNRLNQTAVRAVGSGTMNVVFKDFTQSGGLADAANGNRTKVGGNWTAPSTMTQDNWIIDTSGPADSTAPTVVINCPGQFATVSGTLTGSSGGSTHLMTNTQAIQWYVGDSPADITGYSVTVDGSTGNGLGTPTTLDVAGRGSCTWNTTAVANGLHTITVTGTDAAGFTTARSVTVTVAN